jgi:hypothetical protein
MKNGNNSNILNFEAHSNPNLNCIEVDDVAYSNANWPNAGWPAAYSTSCGSLCFVGIEESSLSNISLYPNPTTGRATIDLEEIMQDIKATLTNSLGQVILTDNYTATNFINLDINAPKGVYFLNLEVDGEVITKKIIKK